MNHGQSRLTWLLGAVALALALGVLWQLRSEIQFRWYLLRARETLGEARDQISSWKTSYEPAEYLTGALQELQSHGEMGFRAILTFLEDDDPRVWVRTAELVDVHFIAAKARVSGYDPEAVNHVVTYVRSRSQKSLLRFLLLEPYWHITEWRDYWSYYDPDPAGKHHWCWYWSGKEGQTLVPMEDGLAFCEEVLQDRFSYDGVYHEPDLLKRRTIDALVAMWNPNGSTGQKPIEVLKRFLGTNQDRELDRHVRLRVDERARDAGLDSSPIRDMFFRVRRTPARSDNPPAPAKVSSAAAFPGFADFMRVRFRRELVRLRGP